jgi:hypothetical protein
MIYFNKRNFSILRLVANGYYISGIRLTEKFTEVTNGYYLVRVSTPKGIDLKDLPRDKIHKPYSRKRIDIVVPFDAAKKIAASIPNSAAVPILNGTWLGSNTSKELIEFLTTDLSTWNASTFKLEDAKYPRTDKLLQKKRRAKLKIGFSTRYLRDVFDTLLKMGFESSLLEFRGDKEPVRILASKVGEDQDVVALVMPMKIDERKKPKPESEPNGADKYAEDVAIADEGQDAPIEEEKEPESPEESS